jgi:hypothetical protein
MIGGHDPLATRKGLRQAAAPRKVRATLNGTDVPPAGSKADH